MKVREKIIVDDIPYIWRTNLDDNGIREFFALYADRIQESEPPKQKPEENSRERKAVFQIEPRLAFLNFRDGVCLWNASGKEHQVLYRSEQDMELWSARRQEIEELREEQAQEQAIERGLLKIEDQHLIEKANAAIKTGEYDIAAAYISARMDLRLSSKGIKGLSYLWLSPLQLWWMLAEFPTSNYGIEFICKYNPKPEIFRNFAHWFSACRDLATEERVEQTGQIYEKGMKLFPDSASLAQAACLFWRRIKRYDLAMKICSEAIKKGMKDETKSGFEGRLKRLEKESKQI